MKEETRKELTPKNYIRKLFEETKDKKLTISYTDIFNETCSSTYKMDWTKEDAEHLVELYDNMTASLARIGTLCDELTDEDKCRALLTEYDFNIWYTYIRPFEPFDGDLELVEVLDFRAETDALEEEEWELLDRHYEWYVQNSRSRLLFDRMCPSHLINRAQRYERLIELNAPDIVLEEEGRCLAKEMVLYYYAVKKIEFDSFSFVMAQHGTYEEALEEIKNGRKRTHWMWFIFPQLRGLGKSNIADQYGIADLDEAEAYLKHKVLGARLIEISSELLKLNENNPIKIFGDIDAVKLKSSMTLFSLVSEDGSVFHKVLEKFFGGEKDDKTLELLQ